MRTARRRGLERIHGEVLSANRHMLGLMQRLEFKIMSAPDDSELKLVDRELPEMK